jgi:hypothetical protein
MPSKLVILMALASLIPIVTIAKLRWASNDRRIPLLTEFTRLLAVYLTLYLLLFCAYQMWGLTRSVVGGFAALSLAGAILLGETGRIGTIDDDNGSAR